MCRFSLTIIEKGMKPRQAAWVVSVLVSGFGHKMTEISAYSTTVPPFVGMKNDRYATLVRKGGLVASSNSAKVWNLIR